MNGKVLFVQLLTASRLLFAAAVAVLIIWDGEAWAAWLAFSFAMACEAGDLSDGFFARRFKVVTDFGKFFDPYADSVSRLIVFWAIAVTGKCWIVVPLVMAVRDITVAYGRIMLAAAGKDVSARMTGKLKALVQGTSAAFLIVGTTFWSPEMWPHIYWWFSIGVIVITILSLVDYFIVAWPYLFKKESMKTNK